MGILEGKFAEGEHIIVDAKENGEMIFKRKK
jgi:hypothetical protein